MPSDYTASSGALRLKGAAGVTKPKKKKPKKPPTNDESRTTKDDTAATDASKDAPNPAASEPDQQVEKREEKKPEKPHVAKTAAEIRYEDSRRRRLEERLRREGARTHKERVEELNKYLSGLSEHHDMLVLFVIVPSWDANTMQAAHWTGIRLAG